MYVFTFRHRPSKQIWKAEWNNRLSNLLYCEIGDSLIIRAEDFYFISISQTILYRTHHSSILVASEMSMVFLSVEGESQKNSGLTPVSETTERKLKLNFKGETFKTKLIKHDFKNWNNSEFYRHMNITDLNLVSWCDE